MLPLGFMLLMRLKNLERGMAKMKEPFDLRKFIDFALENAKVDLSNKDQIEAKIMNDLIKIHIFMCGLIQHHLTPEIKTELKEYIKSWLLMMEDVENVKKNNSS